MELRSNLKPDVPSPPPLPSFFTSALQPVAPPHVGIQVLSTQRSLLRWFRKHPIPSEHEERFKLWYGIYATHPAHSPHPLNTLAGDLKLCIPITLWRLDWEDLEHTANKILSNAAIDGIPLELVGIIQSTRDLAKAYGHVSIFPPFYISILIPACFADVQSIAEPSLTIASPPSASPLRVRQYNHLVV